MGPNIVNIITIIILIALSAFFSATETAYSSLNRIRLKNYIQSGDKKKAKKATLALKISENFDTALSAVLIGNNIVNISAASVGTILFLRLLGDAGTLVSTIVLTIVVLIFGEVVPKSMAKETPETFALAVARPLSILMIIFKPIIFVLVKIKQIFAKKIDLSDNIPSVTEEELKCIIEEIEDEGVLNEHESELMQSALDFDDITVNEILTPRVDVTAVDITENPEVIKDIILEKGFSRIPVYDKTIDNIIGILNEKDFMRAYISDRNVDIRELIQDAIFVPPKKRIADLMKEIQRKKMHLVIVTDQYGGTLGILTLEDIIEELVGEIWDESDKVVPDITKISENKYQVNGDMNIYDLFDFLEQDNIHYQGESYSVSAWALELFEKIPQQGESFDYENLHITVLDTIEQRITMFTVIVNPIKNGQE